MRYMVKFNKKIVLFRIGPETNFYFPNSITKFFHIAQIVPMVFIYFIFYL